MVGVLGRETKRRPMDAYTRTRCSGFTLRLMDAVKKDAGAPGRGLTAPINRETRPPGWQALDKKGDLRRRGTVPSPCCGVPSAAGEGSWREQVPRPSTLSYSIPEKNIPHGGYFLDAGAKLGQGGMRVQVASRESRWNFRDPCKKAIPGLPGALAGSPVRLEGACTGSPGGIPPLFWENGCDGKKNSLFRLQERNFL
ncbi:MAG: hypothetical protein RLZZ165_2229 [Bacteroidota bacterium]|jgi:hypothetical protein